MTEPPGKIRLDKWLWFARVVKTRTIAQDLAGSGNVRINGQRAESASKAVRVGDVLTIALPSRVRVLKVQDVAERRNPANDAVRLYEELG
jgi:ribosome-associated heat shock protein Hsp15